MQDSLAKKIAYFNQRKKVVAIKSSRRMIKIALKNTTETIVANLYAQVCLIALGIAGSYWGKVC